MPNYKIIEVESIGHKYADRLREAGVRTVMSLLKKGCTREGRRALSEATKIDEGKILDWVNMADLFRVKGIGSEYAELLHEAGVDTVKELRNRNADNLHAKLVEINNSYRYVRQRPTLKQIQSWIEYAKELTPMVSY